MHQAAAELAKARAAAAAAAEAAGPQVCDSWEWMVEGVLREVLSSLDFPALKRFRLTCARWRAVADRNLQARRAGLCGGCVFDDVLCRAEQPRLPRAELLPPDMRASALAGRNLQTRCAQLCGSCMYYSVS